jgi:predicted methyltransferase
VAGDWRLPADRARDIWRHPVETLKFWDLKPGQTVVEFWPGAGWYTDILGPFLADTHGKLYEAQLLETNDPSDPSAAEIVEGYRRKLTEKKRIYGDVAFTAFRPDQRPGGAGGDGRPHASSCATCTTGWPVASPRRPSRTPWRP